MPASAPSVETIAALVRLGGGALDLWMLLHATAGDDGISYLTNGAIAEMTGRTSRWIQLASQRLRDAGFLIGGSGMWKVFVPGVNAQVQKFADANESSHQGEQTFAHANESSHAEPASPPPTPPTRVRENVHDVLVTDETNDASPPHTAPPASPGPTPAQIAALDLLADYAAGKTTPLAEVVKRQTRKRAVTAYTPEFQAVWRAYPHFNGRSNKPKSFAKWRSLSPDEQATVERNLPAWQASHDWTRDGGQFVPAMERWLEGERWRASPKPATAVDLGPMTVAYQPSVRPEPIDPAAMARKRAELEAQVERELAARRGA